MNDVNIRFGSIFRCPAPCKTEVLVEQKALTTCSACGKVFDRGEITELLLSQGRFIVAIDSDTEGSGASSGFQEEPANRQ